MAKLNRHIRGDRVKWIVTFILLGALTVGLITTIVNINAKETTREIGAWSYSVGLIGTDGKDIAGKSAISSEMIPLDGFKVELAEDPSVNYTLYFYDHEGTFLLKMNPTGDFDGVTGVPENATQVRIMITPLEDSEVSFFEKYTYVDQLKVTVNKD